jgi:hypothetical protein
MRSSARRARVGRIGTSEAGFSGVAAVTAFAAVLAAAASTASVAYQLWPEHHFSARLEVRDVKQYVTQRSYLTRVQVDPTACGDRDRRVGAVFLLRARLEGVDRSKLSLVSFLYGANESRQLAQVWRQNLNVVFDPTMPINEQIGRAWIPVPTPKTSNRYFVRFELNSGRALVAYTDSGVFAVRPFPHGYDGPPCVLPAAAVRRT